MGKLDYNHVYERAVENFSINSPSIDYFVYLKKKKLIQEFQKNLSSSRKINVLDIGCSNGKDLFVLNDLFPGKANFYCIEISKTAVKNAKAFAVKNGFENFEFATEDLLKAPLSEIYPRETFDFIFMEEVSEHFLVRDQIRIFSEIHKILKKGGVLLITTPNKDALVKRLLGSKKIKKLKDETLKYFKEEEGEI